MVFLTSYGAVRGRAALPREMQDLGCAFRMDGLTFHPMSPMILWYEFNEA